MSRKIAKCGTPSGYHRHWNRGEKACAACVAAVSAASRERRGGKPRKSAEFFFRAFTQLVEAKGLTVLEPGYLGAEKKHRVRCVLGHEFGLTPHSARHGYTSCTACQDIEHFAEFTAGVEAQDGSVLATEWSTSKDRYFCICARGHECWPNPNNVKTGQGICVECAGRDPDAASKAFHARVDAQGGTVLDTVWLGVDKPRPCICPKGHLCSPRPDNVSQGRGICRTCAGREPIAALEAFRARLAKLHPPVTLDATETVWHTAQEIYHAHCAEGHSCWPRPNNIQQGRGACDICANKYSDVFYVVTGTHGLKFGITSGDPKSRLNYHKSARGGGYDNVVRLWSGLRPLGRARAREIDLVYELRARCQFPLPGTREYYTAEVLPLVLLIMDKALGPDQPLT